MLGGEILLHHARFCCCGWVGFGVVDCSIINFFLFFFVFFFWMMLGIFVSETVLERWVLVLCFVHVLLASMHVCMYVCMYVWCLFHHSLPSSRYPGKLCML